MNEGVLNRIEKQLNPRPEIKKWVGLYKRDGLYYRPDDKTPMTAEEFSELKNTPGIGLIIVDHVDRPLPAENEPDLGG